MKPHKRNPPQRSVELVKEIHGLGGAGALQAMDVDDHGDAN